MEQTATNVAKRQGKELRRLTMGLTLPKHLQKQTTFSMVVSRKLLLLSSLEGLFCYTVKQGTHSWDTKPQFACLVTGNSTWTSHAFHTHSRRQYTQTDIDSHEQESATTYFPVPPFQTVFSSSAPSSSSTFQS